MILFAFCILHFANQVAWAYELDTSVDDQIRKNYNPSKLEDDMGLPALPSLKDYSSKNPPQTKPQLPSHTKPLTVSTQQDVSTDADFMPKASSVTKQQINASVQSGIVLKKGTKIPVKLLTNVSDRSKKGSRVKFVSLYPVSTTYFTIPMGTEFYGQIIDSHKPQLAANGGLIKLSINSVVLNGEIQPLNAYVTKANGKHIFFNNIKGKRKYLSSMTKSTLHGRHFFTKMMRVTVSLAADGSSIIVAPFSLLAGTVAASGNILISPVLACFYKGGPVSYNSGNVFEIKLSQNMYISN